MSSTTSTWCAARAWRRCTRGPARGNAQRCSVPVAVFWVVVCSRVDRAVDVCRSYKNGFVWHDLAEDDLVVPATDGEYVLKGSELVDQSSSGERFLLLNSHFF
jgi:hypothetical protein